jgi:hypothetical protein
MQQDHHIVVQPFFLHARGERNRMSKLVVLLVGLVAAAYVAGPAFATEQDPTGYVEVCKATGTPAVSGTFSFTVNGHSTGPINVGECSAPIAVRAGTATIVETPTITPDGFGGSFNSNEYSEVSAIHTSAPGGTDSALVTADLAARTATVTVAAGSQAAETVVTFTNDPVQGYVEVCKSQDLGATLDGQTFPFTIYGAMGFLQHINVTVGACSNPILAPSGHVVVQEDGLATYVDAITSPTGSILASNLANAWAAVSVTAHGTQSGESIVNFMDNSAQLKICKIAGLYSSTLIDQSYTFMVNGRSISVTAGADPGHCVIVPTRFVAGTSVSVTEVPQPGQAVSDIAIAPVGRTFVQSGSDFLGQTATFIIGSGVTTLSYTDALRDPGMLKVCKVGPAGSPNATFTVTGPRGTAPDITMGSDTLSVPVGQCALDPTLLPYAGPQTVTETAMPGFNVSSITVADPDRLVAGSVNLPARSVGAFVGTGTTIVTFTNVAAAPPAAGPPTVGTTSGGTSGTTGSTAAPVSVSAPTATSVVKNIKAASVMSARIVALKSGRFVVVRVSGSAKTATIRVRLIGANGKVLRTVLRTVSTNHAVRVANLKLGPSVRGIRVSVT